MAEIFKAPPPIKFVTKPWAIFEIFGPEFFLYPYSGTDEICRDLSFAEKVAYFLFPFSFTIVILCTVFVCYINISGMFIAKKWRNYENSIISELSGPNGEESKHKRLMSISKHNFANFRQKAKIRKELKRIQNRRRNFLEQKFS